MRWWEHLSYCIRNTSIRTALGTSFAEVSKTAGVRELPPFTRAVRTLRVAEELRATGLTARAASPAVLAGAGRWDMRW